MTKSEITEETYVKLKTPTFVMLVSSIVTLTFGIALIYFGIKNNEAAIKYNEAAIQDRLTVSSYKHDRQLDSVTNWQYRKDMERKMNSVLTKLDILTDPNFKNKSKNKTSEEEN